MICKIGVGTNLGDRRANLERAARELKGLSQGGHLRVSPVYATPALVPEGAPDDWRIPFLNAVIEIKWIGQAQELLRQLKRIETQMGRAPSARWAPRLIDLDILLFGEEKVRSEGLEIPHPSMKERAFVLDPLKDLSPGLTLPDERVPVFKTARRAQGHAPLWMGILNLTPDSFSDGGTLSGEEAFASKARSFEEAGVQVFDLGAESTRPQAQALTVDEELERLRPALEILRESWKDRLVKPLISVDTRHASVAAEALRLGADWINDVSGLGDPQMAEVLKSSTCDYVLMHSLSIPPSGEKVLPPDQDPVALLKAWALDRIDELERKGVSRSRVLFDPGIGFGKTPWQSIAILKRVGELFELPVRILIGHSRKSFMRVWGVPNEPSLRDPETLGVALQMANRGVEVIRVHEPELHLRAYRAYSEVRA